MSYVLTGQDIEWRAGEPANRIRGGLGLALHRLGCDPDCTDKDDCASGRDCLYGQIFAPTSNNGPSGYQNPPRPFVLRAGHLEGKRIRRGERFAFGLHLFDLNPGVMEALCLALAELAADVRLEAVDALDLAGQSRGLIWRDRVFAARRPEALELDLSPQEEVGAVEVAFRTPTEVRGWEDGRRPEFGPLLARLRDRVSTLRGFYGEGPLELDFRGMGERARSVRLVEAEMQRAEAVRRSGRTQQRHPLGGWTGRAKYAGNLGEFWPWLKAGEITGVGHQTVWGKGEMGVRKVESTD